MAARASWIADSRECSRSSWPVGRHRCRTRRRAAARPASRRWSAVTIRNFPPPDQCGCVLRCTKGFASQTWWRLTLAPFISYSHLDFVCAIGLKGVFIRAHEYQPRPLSCKCSVHAPHTLFVTQANMITCTVH